MRRAGLFCAGALLFAAGCHLVDSSSPEGESFLTLTVTGGASQIGLPNSTLGDPITVHVHDIVSGRSISGREVEFHAPTGSGIEFQPARASTDENGNAQVQVRLGSTLGRHAIEVDFAGNPTGPGWVYVEAAQTPLITKVTPGDVQTNEDITITGENFGTIAGSNDVRIDGVRATLLSGTSTELHVRVPRCLGTGRMEVRVHRGWLRSDPAPLDVRGMDVETITLRPGEPLVQVNDMTCLRLAPAAEAAQYLVVPLNAAVEGTPDVNIRLSGSSAPVTVTAVLAQALAQRPDAATEFESRLRQREIGLMRRVQPRVRSQIESAALITVPELGDRRDFTVFAPYFGFDTVRAVARGIGQHVVLYVDQEATDVTTADVNVFVSKFDDPIFATDVEVFGQPSDLDENGRIAVLLTPAVNRLTPPGAGGYIAGYFYGCDLLTAIECPETNGGEVLYSLVPDPGGRFGLTHTREHIQRIMPAVLAHELMHAIHFNQRVLQGGLPSLDAVWLSEALAHSAEDTIAAVIRSRGDTIGAKDMTRENYRRAALYLSAPEQTSLVEADGGGTLGGRGAGWLLLKYLSARVGGDVLGKLTNARGFGSANVSQVSGIEWSVLVRDWASALYASGAPELDGHSPPATQNFGPFDLRAAISSVAANGKYPLIPRAMNGSSFAHDVWLPASSPSHMLVSAVAGESLTLMMAGSSGRAFTADERPALAILRLR
jgi:IPT/TIG domain-containing protein